MNVGMQHIAIKAPFKMQPPFSVCDLTEWYSPGFRRQAHVLKKTYKKCISIFLDGLNLQLI